MDGPASGPKRPDGPASDVGKLFSFALSTLPGEGGAGGGGASGVLIWRSGESGVRASWAGPASVRASGVRAGEGGGGVVGVCWVGALASRLGVGIDGVVDTPVRLVDTLRTAHGGMGSPEEIPSRGGSREGLTSGLPIPTYMDVGMGSPEEIPSRGASSPDAGPTSTPEAGPTFSPEGGATTIEAGPTSSPAAGPTWPEEGLVWGTECGLKRPVWGLDEPASDLEKPVPERMDVGMGSPEVSASSPEAGPSWPDGPASDLGKGVVWGAECASGGVGGPRGVRTGSWTGPPRGERAPRVGMEMRGEFDAGGVCEDRSASRNELTTRFPSEELTTRFPSEDGPSKVGPASCLVAGGGGLSHGH